MPEIALLPDAAMLRPRERIDESSRSRQPDLIGGPDIRATGNLATVLVMTLPKAVPWIARSPEAPRRPRARMPALEYASRTHIGV
jgi:hypothetical protein